MLPKPLIYVFNAAQPGVGRVQVLGSKQVEEEEQFFGNCRKTNMTQPGHPLCCLVKCRSSVLDLEFLGSQGYPDQGYPDRRYPDQDQRHPDRG